MRGNVAAQPRARAAIGGGPVGKAQLRPVGRRDDFAGVRGHHVGCPLRVGGTGEAAITYFMAGGDVEDSFRRSSRQPDIVSEAILIAGSVGSSVPTLEKPVFSPVQTTGITVLSKHNRGQEIQAASKRRPKPRRSWAM